MVLVKMSTCSRYFGREELSIALLAAAVLIKLGRVKGADSAFDRRLDDGLRDALSRPPDVGAADRDHGHLQSRFPEGALRQHGAEFVGVRRLRRAKGAPGRESRSGEQGEPLEKLTPSDRIAFGRHNG